jgi:hypothetical protein
MNKLAELGSVSIEPAAAHVMDGLEPSVERILGPGGLGRIFVVLGHRVKDPAPGEVIKGNPPFDKILPCIAQYILQHGQHIAQGGR